MDCLNAWKPSHGLQLSSCLPQYLKLPNVWVPVLSKTTGVSLSGHWRSKMPKLDNSFWQGTSLHCNDSPRNNHNVDWCQITHSHWLSQQYHWQHFTWPGYTLAQSNWTFYPLHSFYPGLTPCLVLIDKTSPFSSREKKIILINSLSKGIDFADDPHFVEYFKNLPPMVVCDSNLINYQWIFHKQSGTNKLLKHIQKYPDQYFNKFLYEKEIIFYHVMTEKHSWKLLFPTPWFDC